MRRFGQLRRGKQQPCRDASFPGTAEVEAMMADMPSLAGQALEPPRFEPTDWSEHQTFTAADDPDRTAMPWSPPDFVDRKDPASQATEAGVYDMPVFACAVRNVLDEDDCAALIESVNRKGFTPALLNVGGGMQQFEPSARDGHRAIVDSPQLAGWLFEVLRQYVPEELPDGSRLVGLNERLRVLCYTPGQQFPAHYDGMFERQKDHPRAGDFSQITVQIYLHDVPEAHGGATSMFPGPPAPESAADGTQSHQPTAGSVLLFDQALLHQGDLVRRGIKYTIRTEVMYAPPAGLD